MKESTTRKSRENDSKELKMERQRGRKNIRRKEK
jgi:hypothetical protein